MSKKRRKKRPTAWRTVSLDRGAGSRRQQRSELQSTLERAERWIDQGRAREAIEMLEPLLASFPRVSELHYTLGHARAHAGDLLGGLAGYERAMELSGDPGYLLPLASLYAQATFRVHALRAFRRALQQPEDASTMEQAREAMAWLERSVAEVARDLGLSTAKMEEGLYHMEAGQRALDENEYRVSIVASRRAISFLGEWPPPHNNLSLALFYDGQPEKATAAARRVLSHHPDNIHALSNAIRFLAWTGQETEARALWARLRGITPWEETQRHKIASAAAILGEDESVYELLRYLDEPDAGDVVAARFAARAQLHLAVAEANTGRRQARRRLRAIQEDVPWAGDYLAALEAGRPGPGWAQRFPYYHTSELMPRRGLEAFVELTDRQDNLSPSRFLREMERLVARFPQIVLVAEKSIWEEQQVDAGLGILQTIDTAAARAALRRFGLSQAGEDDARLRALTHLVEVGEIARDETMRVWVKGEWREVQVRQFEVSDGFEWPYTRQVADTLSEGLDALHEEDYERAERLFRQVLELEPHAKEAYNSLGVLYARRGDRAQARRMYEAALEIDPLHVLPRCNLAHYLLDSGDVDGAEAMLKPLDSVTQFHPQDMTFYAYTHARVLVAQENYDAAREALEMALSFSADYEPAQDLLRWLDARPFGDLYESFMERQWKRYRSARTRLQARLSTRDVPLFPALSLYTKNALTGTAREVLLWGGWSALRKAELVQRIVETLCDADGLIRIVGGLSDDERAALRWMLTRDGMVPWEEFDARYGNDLEESPYWNWHTPETIMGRLRLRGLVVETTVDGELLISIPVELRPGLRQILNQASPEDRVTP